MDESNLNVINLQVRLEGDYATAFLGFKNHLVKGQNTPNTITLMEILRTLKTFPNQANNGK